MTQRGEVHLEMLRDEAMCPQCEYSLRGLDGDVVTCPECGVNVDIVTLIKIQWNGSWHQLPTYKAISAPAFVLVFLMIGMFVGLLADGIKHHEAIGLAISSYLIALWSWRMFKLWNRFEGGYALKISLLAHVVFAGYLIGIFCVFMILISFVSPTGFMQIAVGIILFAMGVAILVACQFGERYVSSLCVRLYLKEQANLISSGHEH